MEKSTIWLIYFVLTTGTVIWAITAHSVKPLLIILSVLIHEGGHLLAAAVSKGRVTGISVQAGGLRLNGKKDFRSYGSEAFIALGGPLANIMTAPILYIFTRNTNAEFFLCTSLSLAALNLMPISCFDGGRISSSVLFYMLPLRLAEKLCDILSFVFLFILWSMSVYLLLKGGKSMTMFIFSASIFTRIFLPIQKFKFERIRENK